MRIEPDVVPGADALSGQIVGQPIGALVQFAVGRLLLTRHQGDALTEHIGSMLE